MVEAALKTLMRKRLFPKDIFREDFFDASDKATGGVRSPLLKAGGPMSQDSQTAIDQRELSQRDVVFTPLMLRVRDVLDGADRSAPLRLRVSPIQPIADATDEWFYLRARSEQVLAEANAMIGDRTEQVDLDDEYGTGQLGFVLRRGAARSVSAWDRPGGRPGSSCSGPPRWTRLRVEPEDQDVLEDLVIQLLADPVGER